MVMAPTGQAVMHQPSAHWVHVYGAYEVTPSSAEPRITDLAGWNAPVCMYEHANSHRRQPVHRSGWSARDLMGLLGKLGGGLRPLLARLPRPGSASLTALLEPSDEGIEGNRRHGHHAHRA